MPRFFVCCLVMTLWLASTPASQAQAPSDAAYVDAQGLFLRGLALSERHDWSAARAAFLQSLALQPRVSTYFNLAVVALKLQHGREALRALAEFEQRAEGGKHDEFLAAAGSLRARALGMTGTLDLTVQPEDVELRVDEEPFEPGRGSLRPLRLDAGEHVIEARAPGFERASLRVSTPLRGSTARTLTLTPLPVVLPVAVVASTTTPQNSPLTASTKPARIARDPHDVWWRRGWLWASASVLLTGAVVTTVVLARRDDPSPRPADGGTTGIVF